MNSKDKPVKISSDQYEALIGQIPNTGFIRFDKNLDILQSRDHEYFLKGLMHGNLTISNLQDTRESNLKDLLMKLSTNVLDESHETKDLNVDYLQIMLTALPLKDDKGQTDQGIILFQKKSSSLEDTEVTLKKEKAYAEETSKIKTEFIASLSHEIRTPLNAIVGFAEQLKKTPLDNRQLEYLEIIDNSSVHLLDLVNEILTFSKIESGELHLDEVDFNLESVIKDVYNAFKMKAESKKINFLYNIDNGLKMVFRNDVFRLKQIIINLVSNAIKFTNYGYIDLNATLLEKDNDNVWMKLVVTDTGIGIPENKIQDIFKEFKQADAGITRLHGGTGLGLTICKRLTELMKGRVSVSSTEGKGSKFIVEIPLCKSPVESISENNIEISKEVLSGKSGLIVDDDALSRLLGKIILENLNMEIDLAADGKEAKELINKKPYQVILLDIHMPIMSGIDIARYIRQKTNNQDVKIIALSAAVIKDDLDLFSKEGFNDYLIKPYREISLYNKLCNVLDIESEQIKPGKTEIILHEMENLSFYNLSEVRIITKGNEDFFNEMIQTFINNATNGLDQMETAYKQKDWNLISEIAHKLIPSYKHLEIKTAVSDLIELRHKSTIYPVPDQLMILIRKIDETTRVVLDSLKDEKF